MAPLHSDVLFVTVQEMESMQHRIADCWPRKPT